MGTNREHGISPIRIREPECNNIQLYRIDKNTHEQVVFIEAIYSHGSVSLYANGLLVYTGLIFPSDSGVGEPQMLEIGGGHPFIVNGKIILNSNPLIASIANFVVYNGIMGYNEIKNPTFVQENSSDNTALVYSNRVNV